MLEVLADRTYRHLFAAQVIALLGTGLATVALGLLAYDLAGANAGAVLGTALMIGASGFYLLFFAGLPWKVILGGGALVGASLPVVWHFLHDYQQRRVLTLLDPA